MVASPAVTPVAPLLRHSWRPTVLVGKRVRIASRLRPYGIQLTTTTADPLCRLVASARRLAPALAV